MLQGEGTAGQRSNKLLQLTCLLNSLCSLHTALLISCPLLCNSLMWRDTYQWGGWGFAHLRQDSGFSKGCSKNPQDRKEQRKDGEDTIHLKRICNHQWARRQELKRLTWYLLHHHEKMVKKHWQEGRTLLALEAVQHRRKHRRDL